MIDIKKESHAIELREVTYYIRKAVCNSDEESM